MTAAALPRRGETDDNAGRQPDDTVMWSVTTIIGCLDKPALVPWAVNVTAARTVANWRRVTRRLEEEGTDSAVEYITGLRWDNGGLLSDTQLGTVAHGLFDQYALSGERPRIVPELHPDYQTRRKLLQAEDVATLGAMLDRFDEFLNHYQPEYLACEVVVFHPEYGYAGQVDAFLSIDRVPLIGDYKTSRKTYDSRGKVRTPYPEVGLQLAAYRHASGAAAWRARRYESYKRRYYLLSAEERAAALPVPEVEGGVAVKITPDHVGVYPVRCGPRQWDAFLYCLEVARWSFNEANHVVGNPMIPPNSIEEALGVDPFADLPQF